MKIMDCLCYFWTFAKSFSYIVFNFIKIYILNFIHTHSILFSFNALMQDFDMCLESIFPNFFTIFSLPSFTFFYLFLPFLTKADQLIFFLLFFTFLYLFLPFLTKTDQFFFYFFLPFFTFFDQDRSIIFFFYFFLQIILPFFTFIYF